MASEPEAYTCGVASDLDVPHLWVPEAYCLDMDRTTLRSAKCIDYLTGIALDPQYGVDSSSIIEAQSRTEADGGTYNPAPYLERELDREAFDRLGQAFMDVHDPALTYQDALPLYTSLLSKPATPHHVLTFGTTASGHPSLWQGMKAVHSSFNGYVEITSQPDKGPHIESMRGPSGTFDYLGLDEDGRPIAVYHAASVVLVDDKATAHAHLPKDCRGYLLIRPDEPRLPSQGTEVPEAVTDRVQIIPDLSHVAILHEVKTSSCVQSDTVVDAGNLEVAAFRPAYPSGEHHFGMVISRTTVFKDIRKEIEAYTVR